MSYPMEPKGLLYAFAGYRPKKLLNVDTNAKTVKGQKKGYLTGVLYLAPADLSGFEVCPMSSAGCRAACLNTAGRAGIIKRGEETNAIQIARIAKTRWYFQDRESFLEQLVKEIQAVIRKAKRMDLIPAIRLNGTSDIPWERVPYAGKANIMEHFKDVVFYDYTKRHNRKGLPANYTLTYSLCEDNDDRALLALQSGFNVAAVFDGDLPEEFMGYPVINGDESDLRFLDPVGVIVGLKAKGKAKKDTTGFVRRAA